jgi:hypothetical protein
MHGATDTAAIGHTTGYWDPLSLVCRARIIGAFGAITVAHVGRPAESPTTPLAERYSLGRWDALRDDARTMFWSQPRPRRIGQSPTLGRVPTDNTD